ncbi:coiled-coil domain-containing protein 162-like isoform X8 [Physeter macrocephalus]|uniref:Coiled-coil domain-containing protein 162-like isoform X8 n=1 Tax=Physeter macrocephalus TaxID=9755 RepID=A0A9W2WWN3_PHYMC|nr:coiled-coil domain-containing protein 162-like isoform X8 [Physeter catodon]
MFLLSGFMSFLRKVLEAAFSESEPSKQEQLLALEQDNCSLATLVLKMRSLGHWRLAVQQAHFRGQLSRAEKAQLLKELDHRVTQEALHRQQLDLMKIASMEKLLEDVEQQEQHLQLLTEEAKRASKLGQLQQKKIQGELRQVTPVRGSKSGCTSHSCFIFPLSFPCLSCIHSGVPHLCHSQKQQENGNIYTWVIVQAACDER